MEVEETKIARKVKSDEMPSIEYVKEYLPPDPADIKLKDPNLEVYWEDLESVVKAEYRLEEGVYPVTKNMLASRPDRGGNRIKAAPIEAPHGDQNTDNYVIMGGQGKGSIAVCAHKDYCKSRNDYYRKKNEEAMKSVVTKGGGMSVVRDALGVKNYREASEAAYDAARKSGLSREDAKLVSMHGGAMLMNA